MGNDTAQTQSKMSGECMLKACSVLSLFITLVVLSIVTVWKTICLVSRAKMLMLYNISSTLNLTLNLIDGVNKREFSEFCENVGRDMFFQ